VSDVSTQLNQIIELLQSQGHGIEALNTRLGVLERDVQQVKAALRHLLPEDQRDLDM
jgi:prefoldin subunit 5